MELRLIIDPLAEADLAEIRLLFSEQRIQTSVAL